MLGNGDEEQVMQEIAETLRQQQEQDRSYGKIYETQLAPKKGMNGGVTFALTFGISLAVLLLIMLIVLSGTSRNGELFGSNESSQPLSGTNLSADHSLDSYHPTIEDDNRLLVVINGGEDAQSHYWLLRISPTSGEMTVLTFPDSLSSGEETLQQAAGSFSDAQQAVQKIFGEDSVDRVVWFERENAEKMITALGGMEWEFHDRYQSESLDIPVGRHLLDGGTLMQLLDESASGQQPSAGQLPSGADILAAFLGQRFTASAFNRDDGLFETLVSWSEGNISVMDYYNGKKFLRWFLYMGAGYQTIAVGETGNTVLSDGERQLARERLGLSASE